MKREVEKVNQWGNEKEECNKTGKIQLKVV
jgi:hypothetical protein